MRSSVWFLFSMFFLIVILTTWQYTYENPEKTPYKQLMSEDGQKLEAISRTVTHFFGKTGARYEYDEQKNKVVVSKVDVEYVQAMVGKFQRDKGYLPRSLSELEPDYIERVPGWFYYDPTTGKVTDRPATE